ncbi:B-cell receptor CD22-like [Anomaloglossus baeobatrachus]|uniref:B-cell receptor CD22-like n=1 Tax=Anomaloglossus baeobatrachus TaxID=238106 RepID=UPI003F5038F7
MKDKVMEGSDVTLQCNSSSTTKGIKYEWFKGKNKTKLPDIGRETTVRKVTRDTEPYSCAAISAVGRGESCLTDIPVLYAAIGVDITVKNEGEFVKLICDFLSSRPDVTHYTWMRDGSILKNQLGKTLTVKKNMENYGQYSCIAHNRVGNSSSEEFYLKGSRSSRLIILLTTMVMICLLLLVYGYWSYKHKKRERKEADATYTDLIRSEITETYDQLKPVTPADSAPVGSEVETIHEYENVH